MIKTVLIPLDGSRLSESVLAPALRLLGPRGGKLVLFHAVNPSEYFSLTAAKYVQQARQRADAYLRELAASLAGKGVLVVERIVTGEASREILAEARRSRADLIVMSSHGRSGIPDWPFGSVSERVLKTATLPVLVLREGAGQPAGIRKMMIALDGSEEAMKVLPSASEVASAQGASVVLVHVGRHLPLTLQRAILSLHRQGIPFKIRLLHGDPATTILAAAQEEQVDLLAVATTGGRREKALRFTGLSEALLSKSGASVLSVRSDRVA